MIIITTTILQTARDNYTIFTFCERVDDIMTSGSMSYGVSSTTSRRLTCQHGSYRHFRTFSFTTVRRDEFGWIRSRGSLENIRSRVSRTKTKRKTENLHTDRTARVGNHRQIKNAPSAVFTREIPVKPSQLSAPLTNFFMVFFMSRIGNGSFRNSSCCFVSFKDLRSRYVWV